MDNIVNSEYEKYVGKCFRTSSTSVDYIFGIEYSDSYGITFETISAFGCSDESFEVYVKYDEIRLNFEEVEDYFFSKEISKQEFLDFIQKAFDHSKEELLNSLK